MVSDLLFYTFRHTHRADFGNLKVSAEDGNSERGVRTSLARGAVQAGEGVFDDDGAAVQLRKRYCLRGRETKRERYYVHIERTGANSKQFSVGHNSC